ncbi:MAG TPA: protein kinase [Terriglobia bacterium]|nr:protein kinase [Terriglobia bacterium]
MASAEKSALAPLSGRTIAHYRVLEKIGAGGMGEVYLAHDEQLDREVALKVLPQGDPTDKSHRKRLRKEAQALSKLSHPNIETLFEFITTDDLECLVVEYVAGTTLSDMLAAGALSEKEVARFGVQLADGLDSAHSQRVVHCDLKPDNLRITSDGRLKILDFGIARLLKPPRETTRTDTTTDSTNSSDQGMVGTLPYMAPEQLKAERADARTDIYSAGAVLYEMATGKRPFLEEAAPQLIEAIWHVQPVPPRALNPRISPEMERIILKCLEKEPENRYQAARELQVDLRQLTLPATTRPAPVFRRASKWWSQIGWVALFIFVLLTVRGLLRFWRRPKTPLITTGAGPIQSLAVLPLQNLSSDPQQEYFADGMTDLMITDLSQIRALRVISRTSSMKYKGTQKPVPQIARELHVDAVIEGSVLRDGGQVRITAQLIQGTNDENLWAQSYDRDLRDVLKLQADVAGAIANEIKIAVTAQEQNRLTNAPPVIPAAYEAYLKGRYHWNGGGEHDWLKARQYFEQAAQLDPNYAPAYSGLAEYYCFTDSLAPRVKMPKAKQFALRALEIDPNLADAHTSLGAVRFFADWNWPQAEREYQRALELDPGNLEARRLYADFLSETGRDKEALAEIRQAQQLDPLSISNQVMVGWTLYFARKFDQAVDQCRKATDLEPNSANAHDCLGLGYLAKNMYPKAIKECRKSMLLSGNDLNQAVDLATANAAAGNRGEAEKTMQEWRALARRSYVPSTFFARVHFALGEKEQGLARLEKAYAERDEYLTLLGVDPAFDSVRSDPRFQDLWRRVRRERSVP